MLIWNKPLIMPALKGIVDSAQSIRSDDVAEGTYPVIVSSKSIRPDLREWFQR